MSQLIKANSVANIYQALRQRPLELDELDEFYQDTNSARGKRTRSQTARFLNNNIGSGSSQHILFVGNGGCGKSTELRHLEQDIQKDFLVFNYSVFTDLDPMSINYIELIIITMEKLFAYINESKINISPEYIKSISQFLQTTEIQEVKNKYFDMQAEVGASVDSGIPYLAKFFAKFRASAKSSRSMKEVLSTNIEPHFSTLLNYCNDLIKEIKLKLKDLGKKDLVIIIEDLDKIKLTEAENLFLNYAQQITSIQSNVIYTYPIALFYNLKFNQIKNLFSKRFELPMIKVATKTGEPVSEGIQTMENIIKARMDLSLFEKASILKDFIKLSGGVIRDLFFLISEAAESCQDDERIIINQLDKQYAINSLKSDYRNTIADNPKHNITASDYYQVLQDLANSDTKIPTNITANMHLRQNLTILSYNGENWSDVHPIVKENMRDLDLLDS